MSKYIGTKAVNLSTTSADVTGNADIDGNLTVGGNLTVSGTTITVDSATAQTVDLGDDDKIRLGDDDDLQIYHDSATGNSVINESGGGNLTIQGNELRLQTAGGGNYFRGVNAGASSIFYSNSIRFETTTNGVKAHGNVVSEAASAPELVLKSYPGTQDTIAKIISGRSEFSGTNSFLRLQTNDGTSTETRIDITDGGDISFNDTSGNAKFFWDASAASLGLGVTSISTQGDLYIGGTGNSDDVLIGLSPTNSTGGQNPLSQIGASADGTYGSTLYFNTRGTGGSVSTAMYISSAAFVGIGEADPQKKLHVHTNNGQGVAIFEHNYSYSQDNWAIKFQNDNVNSYMGANDGASRAWEVRTNGYYFGSGLYWLDSGATNSGAIAIEEASGDINFYASNSLNSANNFTPQSRMRLLAADQSGGESALLIGTAQTAQTSYNELLKVASSANNGDGGITISSYRPQLNFIDNSGGAEDFRMWNDSAQFNFNKNGDHLLAFDAYGRLSGQDANPTGGSSTQRGAGSIYVKGIGTPWMLYQSSNYWVKLGEIEFTNGSAFGYAFRKLRINGTGATNGDYAVGDLIINYKQQGTGTYQSIALHNTRHFNNYVAYKKTTGGGAGGGDLVEFWIKPYTTYTEIEVHNIQDSTGGMFSASGSTGFRFSMVSTGSATQPSGSTLIATSSYPDT